MLSGQPKVYTTWTILDSPEKIDSPVKRQRSDACCRELTNSHSWERQRRIAVYGEGYLHEPISNTNRPRFQILEYLASSKDLASAAEQRLYGRMYACTHACSSIMQLVCMHCTAIDDALGMLSTRPDAEVAKRAEMRIED